MKLRTRVATVIIVLLVGFVFAAPFRRTLPPSGPLQTVQRDSIEPAIPTLSIRHPVSAKLSAPVIYESSTSAIERLNSEDREPSSTSPRPTLRLAPEFDPPSQTESAVSTPSNPQHTERDTAIEQTLPPMELSPRWHRVVYGDNLEKLAEDYLGSRNHYLLIYEANRDVLASPNVLPIGAELQIPRAPPKQPPERPPERPPE